MSIENVVRLGGERRWYVGEAGRQGSALHLISCRMLQKEGCSILLKAETVL